VIWASTIWGTNSVFGTRFTDVFRRTSSTSERTWLTDTSVVNEFVASTWTFWFGVSNSGSGTKSTVRGRSGTFGTLDLTWVTRGGLIIPISINTWTISDWSSVSMRTGGTIISIIHTSGTWVGTRVTVITEESI
jgi:hypothetical protein